MVRALRHRNYRLFFGGQTVSLVGTWVTRVATGWLVYRLTGSELLLGLVAFAGQIPLLLLAPVAGVLVDRWDRHRVLVVTQVLSLLQSLALALLTLTGRVDVAQVVVLQFLQGVINAFDTPARHAFVVEMLDDRRDLPNAIALNSTMFNASRIVGPSVGGALTAAVGEGWCFLADAASYLAVIASLLAMRLRAREGDRAEAPVLEELRAGLAFVSGFLPARSLLLLVAIVSTLGMPYLTLMPVVVVEVLHGGPKTLGALMTAAGAGALAAALYLAARRTVLGLRRVIVASTTACSLALVLFALSPWLWLSLPLLAVVGGGMMLQNASTNTILQTVVEGRLRGRVMAWYTVAILGTAPLGSLGAGLLAEHVGAPATILLGGLLCLAGAGWFARQREAFVAQLRPVYRELGLVPAPGSR